MGRQAANLLSEAIAVAIFAMTYLVIVLVRLPGFRLDRAGGAPTPLSVLTMSVGVLWLTLR